MKKVNLSDIEETHWDSPKGAFEGNIASISEALGRDPSSTDVMKRQPFDLAIVRIPPNKKNFPYHAHGAQWELYLVVSGRGQARDETGATRIVKGDAFIYGPGEAHQLMNDSDEDLVFYVIADNPLNDTTYYPDSNKWNVKIPARQLVRSEPLDYFDGEE